MAAKELRLCMNCMHPLDGNGKCPHCGGAAVQPNPPLYLPQYTVLDNHYYVGRVLRRNGESVVYLAYNSYTETPVELREYFPTTLCGRDGYAVVPRPGMDIQYKAILSDFTDLHRSLSRLKNVPILTPILDIFEANQTVYVVSQPFDGIRFNDFLNLNVGELTWEQTRGFLMPLLISMQHLHNANILHRGISPETLLISRTGEIRLIDFCLPAVRTAHCELNAELYNGYAAPEQYSMSGWHGTWTDVYALAAVMYKTLTGTMPPNAGMRQDDSIFAVSELNASVPQSVSDILTDALRVDPNSRIKTVQELRARLTSMQVGGEAEGDTRRVASKEEVARAEAEALAIAQQEESRRLYAAARRRRRRRPHYGLLSGIVSTIIMCSIVLYILYGMYNDRQQMLASNSQSVSSVSESEYAGTMPVPSIVGKSLESVQRDAQYKGRITFSIVYEANADYAPGVIFEQSPKAGDSIEIGGILNIKVSEGVKTVEMPEVVGIPQEEAIALLEVLEIDYEIIPVYDDTQEKYHVVRTNYEVGDSLTLARDVVFLFVNQSDKLESGGDHSGTPGFLGPAAGTLP